MDKVSVRVKEAREKKGLSIEEISQQTLLPISVIKDIENGAFDKYEGDELYVKMYLKKLASALDLDGDNLTKEYYALTQEIKLSQMEEMQKQQEQEAMNKEDITFVDKMGDTFKNISTPNLKPKKKKSVYEDHYIARYVKIAIVAIIVVGIVGVMWYALVSSQPSGSDKSFSNDSSSVEGDVSKNDSTAKEKEDEEAKKAEEAKKVEASQPTITRNSPMDYSVKFNDDNPTFELKIEFVGRTWANMEVNGSDYSEFKAGIYNSSNKAESMDAEPETVTLTFTKDQFQNLFLSLGYNRGHRFYINNKQIDIPSEDYSDTNRFFKLAMVK